MEDTCLECSTAAAAGCPKAQTLADADAGTGCPMQAWSVGCPPLERLASFLIPLMKLIRGTSEDARRSRCWALRV